MSVSPFDSGIYGGLFGAPAVADLFSDTAEVAAMIAVERALARAEGRCGVIPAAAAAAIDAGLAGIVILPETLGDGTASAGVPVPALVAALRDKLPPEAGQWLHWGATSQDILDSALALRLDRAMAVFAASLDALVAVLEAASLRWADQPMAGRTRSQIAAPITFGFRIARWAQPLIGLRTELEALRPRVARVQFGGAVGANAAVAPHGEAVIAALAAELGLRAAPPWHTDRVAIGALAGWCAGLCVALGKMAGDVVLLGRSESAEAVAGAGGGSSTMPQKANPVAAETIVALARFAAGLTGPVHLAALQAEERDGSAWALEWLVLPQAVVAAAACLRHAEELARNIAPDPRRMAEVMALGGGAVMAEAASFILAQRLPRAEAQAIVAAAVRSAEQGPVTLAEALARLAPGAADWAAALNPAREVQAAVAAAGAIFDGSE